jgi:hypothetical protein
MSQLRNRLWTLSLLALLILATGGAVHASEPFLQTSPAQPNGTATEENESFAKELPGEILFQPGLESGGAEAINRDCTVLCGTACVCNARCEFLLGGCLTACVADSHPIAFCDIDCNNVPDLCPGG